MLRTPTTFGLNSSPLRPLLIWSIVSAVMAVLIIGMSFGEESKGSGSEKPRRPVSTEAGARDQRAPAQLLIWGIPRKTVIAYEGKYDETSGLSKWNPTLVLKDRNVDNISGTLIFGNKKELQFSSQTRKLDETRSTVQSFLLKSTDGLLLTVSRINNERIEITMGESRRETIVFDLPLQAGKGELKIIKGRRQIADQLIEKSESLRLLPLLAYKLGAEMRLTGNKYPAALVIHRLALSIAKLTDIRLMMARRGHFEPIDRSDPDYTPSSDIGGGPVCVAPGPPSQECYGMCGDKCVCWDFACGDCCCYQGCAEHDAFCNCYVNLPCWVTVVAAPLNCSPCKNLGNIPCSGGSGTFYCRYTDSWLNNGVPCRPKCESGESYCERFGRCMHKAQCNNTACGNTSCGSDQICYNGECLDT
jgi:hypothetical protein